MTVLVGLATLPSPALAQHPAVSWEMARQAAPVSPVVPPGAPAPAAQVQTWPVPCGTIVPARPVVTGPAQRLTSVPDQRTEPPASERATPGAFAWLDHVNAVRASAGLLPVVEEAEWSAGSVLRSRYMVKNNYVGHDEDASNP